MAGRTQANGNQKSSRPGQRRAAAEGTWHPAPGAPEEAARIRVGLLRELAATGERLVATHLSFPYCRVAVDGDVFRWIPALWEY
jgi:hypothetical protein